MKRVQDRFLEYVKINTTADESTGTTPSFKGEFDLANVLEKELKVLGLKDVEVCEHGYVYATLPSNTDKEIPVIGFISHMDTSPDMTGENVNPQVVKYNGGDIILNKEKNIVLSPKEFPELEDYKGKELITTDGTTLLGADDKAGISEIMAAMEYLVEHPEIKHGEIRVAFTPDEEIGEGTKFFNVDKFGAKYAYTIDGGTLGELEYENFNAASGKVIVKGRNVHPGYAYNKMINSMKIALEFDALLPQMEVPEKTKGYEGFFHLTDIKGEVEETTLSYIIRDFSFEGYKNRMNLMKEKAQELNEKYKMQLVEVEIKESYRNMKEKIEPVMFVVENAKLAMEMSDVVPNIRPIRGGTDGARLSFMGVPTPNIFTGGENFHGKYEYIPIESMEKAVEVILNIVKVYTK
ncbi:peptidase T [Clostridium sp. 'White wine YQ']|uniref:peptidase T n=1 Tax=Clostridium sp. 'White wine YQ' TaxID=3027474 RepID=UPI0023657647|nr:peptidase T [Clostridium sp. 'White wine YQ']MDD7796030.1 peptidase T [Clostridium sp. 'White wine YQ']